MTERTIEPSLRALMTWAAVVLGIGGCTERSGEQSAGSVGTVSEAVGLSDSKELPGCLLLRQSEEYVRSGSRLFCVGEEVFAIPDAESGHPNGAHLSSLDLRRTTPPFDPSASLETIYKTEKITFLLRRAEDRPRDGQPLFYRLSIEGLNARVPKAYRDAHRRWRNEAAGDTTCNPSIYGAPRMTSEEVCQNRFSTENVSVTYWWNGRHVSSADWAEMDSEVRVYVSNLIVE